MQPNSQYNPQNDNTAQTQDQPDTSAQQMSRGNNFQASQGAAQTQIQPDSAMQQSGSKAMPIWSFVLAILGFLTGLLFFISGPLALAALILGIIALKKHKPAKGLSIAGVVISVITLLFLPVSMAIFFAAYNGVAEKAKSSLEQSKQTESNSLELNQGN